MSFQFNLHYLLFAGLVLILSACGHLPSPIQPNNLIGRDADFAVVLPSEGDSLASLARDYLGDAELASRISEFNRTQQATPGKVLVIPLNAPPPSGLYSHGYQTIPILCYHRFGDHRGKLTVSRSAFASQMAYLADNGFKVMPLSALIPFLRGHASLPPKTVILTMDDGYRSVYDIAYPVLKQHGFPATVFLYSDFVGATDALSWAQMQAMEASGLIDVQPHSKSHGNLAVLQSGERQLQYQARLEQEVTTPITVLRSQLGVNSYSYAFPYGDTNEHVTSLLTKHGVEMGLTVTPGGNGFFAYPHMLKRTMIFGDDDLATFKAKLLVFVNTPRKP
ncbi:polysaccharide deacetylase family protein [Chitinivorax sp. B]|uniref:polysaccharide deacetylase family protein n=1 Tax=Chitinivorax sp. B TaxID=2502235 RepID=UPI0010F8F5DC|nr:polysaccharide deacetylase family protein [Chitinivorax sp. B]